MTRKTSIQNYFYLNLFAPQFPVVTTAHPLPHVEHRVRIPGNIHSPCSAERLNISTWWNSKDGTAASLHHRTQGSCKDHYAGWMLRGLKSVTWQLLPQHAPSFEGKSSKHTHTLGFDYFFLKLNKLNKTNLMLWGDQMLWLHCTALYHINKHSGRKEWWAVASRVPEVDGNGTHFVRGCLWQFADEPRKGLCWESWTPLLTWEETYSTAPNCPHSFRAPGSGLCNHRELWTKMTLWALINLLCHTDSHSLETGGWLIHGPIL